MVAPNSFLRSLCDTLIHDTNYVSMNMQLGKFLVPVSAMVLLVGCGAPVPPPPPAANNPLASVLGTTNPLGSILPGNSEMNNALNGLNALGNLGNAFDANGNLKDQNAVNNFANSLEQIANNQAKLEYEQKESIEFPSDAPAVVSSYAYTNGKLTNATYQSMDPIDLRLSYDTLDTPKTVSDFYKNVVKNLPAGWKTVSQSAGTDNGTIEVQTKEGTADQRINVSWEQNGAMTSIRIRSWMYSL